ncbi:MAG: hypothetical protein UV46_C0069G0005 [Candidatus Gottesmanbacteria bacterium GW2011_GWC2_42_8]|uniref:Uncharacterized protein n=1 Tax=Candidatus Gottesmanbacteria bacterium GW2011_GWA2_43_14 TaxID=1618443 RepID=A0A0G1DFP3_9BACT|nr:MAG: hypothetical protein UV46_C0069G0005 [Candidatus Gottesmanbacteria bacterium GW2011_GWC2_42_8]KKS96464.1 MAG: hypothetical protein UV73_C0010G0049 [Candidatus Gottesmanbacteria bacterium GW2011_GWA2_43_14]
MDTENLVKKLNKIELLVSECLEILTSNKSGGQNTPTLKKTVMDNSKNTGDYILWIVNKIKNCPESEKIDSQILAKNAIPGRILLPYYICYKYFSEQGLTSGDIEKITSELSVRIKTPNVSNYITNSLWKFLDGDSSRVKGKPVTYKLNRKGATFFESLLNQK